MIEKLPESNPMGYTNLPSKSTIHGSVNIPFVPCIRDGICFVCNTPGKTNMTMENGPCRRCISNWKWVSPFSYSVRVKIIIQKVHHHVDKDGGVSTSRGCLYRKFLKPPSPFGLETSSFAHHGGHLTPFQKKQIRQRNLCNKMGTCLMETFLTGQLNISHNIQPQSIGWLKHVSNEKNPLTFHYTGCLIGIGLL